MSLPTVPDLSDLEARARERWDEAGIHVFDPDRPGEVFSVDTPPPYVSAAHLHVGHAMSYAQAEFVVRYQRMRGRNVFYPMGFDDNGLPTERYVERAHKVRGDRLPRSEFRALCLDETARGAVTYERLWRALGLSVDWRHRYSTIDDHCRATAQRSFVDLLAAGRIERRDEPVFWDPEAHTSLAQADLETVTRRGHLHEVAFGAPDGRPLVIATTRPELLAACVALYCHPDDDRYQALIGSRARVPLFGHHVPILADTEVDRGYGTGLMMVCTFGEGEDVMRWRRDGLDTRVVIGPDGRMTADARGYEGLPAETARAKILLDLGDALLGTAHVRQQLSVSERTGRPVEFRLRPHWVLRLLDLRGDLRAAADELDWHPAHMKARLVDWIDGLKWDWNLSRQRAYGVPFPVWLCAACGHPVTPPVEALPVDPTEQPAPVDRCPECGHDDLRGDPDVMDTWMTSSLTPQIVTNWHGSGGRAPGPTRPLTVRVQGFEIIRTWLFTTVVKGLLHDGALPWDDVMISGWGLNEQGRKIAKRDLETPAGEFNRYDPEHVITRHGADALRHWAAGTTLGHDSRYSEREVRAGRKVVLKLWNVARFVESLLGADRPPAPIPDAERSIEDRWLLAVRDRAVGAATKAFEAYDYAGARAAADGLLWNLADHHLELVKDRFRSPDGHDDLARASAARTLWEVLRDLLALHAPVLPFVTDDLWHRLYADGEDAPSLHVTAWPEITDPRPEPAEMSTVLAVLRACRTLRSDRRIPQGRVLDRLVVDGIDVSDAALAGALRAAARTRDVVAAGVEGGIALDVEGRPRLDLV